MHNKNQSSDHDNMLQAMKQLHTKVQGIDTTFLPWKRKVVVEKLVTSINYGTRVLFKMLTFKHKTYVSSVLWCTCLKVVKISLMKPAT